MRQVDAVRCVNCTSFGLRSKTRGVSPLAEHGFGYCEKKPAYTYMSARYLRNCSDFSQASDDVISARVKYLQHR